MASKEREKEIEGESDRGGESLAFKNKIRCRLELILRGVYSLFLKSVFSSVVMISSCYIVFWTTLQDHTLKTPGQFGHRNNKI